MRHDHPYVRHPIIMVSDNLRRQIIEGGLASEQELEMTIAAAERIARDPDYYFTSLTLVQTLGFKP